MTTDQTPLISIVMATYNRASTIDRAINSVLRQTHKNLELIIVDDGSIDNTQDVLSRFSDPRIRLFKHEKNKGLTAAKNTGLNAIYGEWFTILDDDDEIVPQALETLIGVPNSVDPKIDAVTCNCTDSATGNFSGRGLDKDQYIDEATIVQKCAGEFWGITKTSLLGSDRFNEKLPGNLGTLWYKINSKATRYYIHKALRIYYTEGADRVTKLNVSDKRLKKEYQARIFRVFKDDEEFYLHKIAQYDPQRFSKMCTKGIITSRAIGDVDTAKYYYEFLSKSQATGKLNMFVAWLSLRGGSQASAVIYWVYVLLQKLNARRPFFRPPNVSVGNK